MGCFNRMGFYSKLPITYGDETVLIICYTYNKYKRDTTPCYVDDDIQPLFLPIKGKYDDYGSIEDYDDSEGSIVNTIENIVGLKMNKFLNSIHRCSFTSMKDIQEIEKAEEKELCSIYEDDKNYKIALENITNLCDTKLLGDREMSLLYVLERRDVYDKMAYMSEKSNMRNIITSRLNFRKNNDIKGFVTNEYDISHWAMTQVLKLDKNSKNERKNIDSIYEEYKKDDFKVGFSNGDTLCKGYKNSMFKTEHEFNEVINFLLFHRTLTILCGSYNLSQYGSQEICCHLDSFKELNDLYSSIIIQKKQEYSE